MILASPTLDAFTERARRHLRREQPGPLDPRSDPKGDHALDAMKILPEAYAGDELSSSSAVNVHFTRGFLMRGFLPPT